MRSVSLRQLLASARSAGPRPTANRGTQRAESAAELARRLDAVRSILLPTCGLSAVGLAYVALTWDRPHRLFIAVLLVLASAAAALVSRAPLERVLCGRWREPLFLTWSALNVVLITTGVAADGGLGSPLALVFLVPLIFAGASYPPAQAGAVTLMVIASYAGLAALAPLDTLADAVMFAGCLVFTSLLVQLRRRSDERHRRALEDLVGQLQTTHDDFAAVARVMRHVAAGVDARQTICEAARELADAVSVSLVEPDSDGGLVVTAGVGADLVGQRIDLIGPSGCAVAFQSRRRFFVPRMDGEPAVSHRLTELTGAVSAVFEPVLRDDAVVGVLAVLWTHPVLELTSREVGCIAMLSHEAAVAIERADRMAALDQQARSDPLTGLPNRRAWDEALERELARARRSGAELSLALVDLDRFKALNDEHGHEAGDDLLRRVAARWSTQIRPSDVLARLGGDEFALLLPGSGLEEARALLVRLRAEMPLGHAFSAGLVSSSQPENAQGLTARADAALYDAKRGGRDRVGECPAGARREAAGGETAATAPGAARRA